MSTARFAQVYRDMPLRFPQPAYFLQSLPEEISDAEVVSQFAEVIHLESAGIRPEDTQDITPLHFRHFPTKTIPIKFREKNVFRRGGDDDNIIGEMVRLAALNLLLVKTASSKHKYVDFVKRCQMNEVKTSTELHRFTNSILVIVIGIFYCRNNRINVFSTHVSHKIDIQGGTCHPMH
jgi:hypothetical protein